MSTRPRLLQMFWSEGDAVVVEVEEMGPFVIRAGDTVTWDVPTRPHLRVKIELERR